MHIRVCGKSSEWKELHNRKPSGVMNKQSNVEGRRWSRTFGYNSFDGIVEVLECD